MTLIRTSKNNRPGEPMIPLRPVLATGIALYITTFHAWGAFAQGNNQAATANGAARPQAGAAQAPLVPQAEPPVPTFSNLQGKRVTFPKRLTGARDFLETLGSAARVRIVAPEDLTPVQVTALNQAVGGKTLAADAAFATYLKLVKHTSFEIGFLLVVVRPSDEARAEPQDLRIAVRASGFDLVNSLSKDVIADMYATSFLTAERLNGPAKETYFNFLRTSRVLDDLMSQKRTTDLSDSDLESLPLRFLVCHSASFKLVTPDGNETFWVGLYDYGRGPIGEGITLPPRGAAPVNNVPKAANIPAASRGFTQVAETSTLTVQQATPYLIIDAPQAQPKTTYTDKNLAARRVVITRGRYGRQELKEAVALAGGVEVRYVEELVYIGNRGKERNLKLQSPVLLKIASQQAFENLDQLQIENDLPFGRDLFSGKQTVSFGELSPEQQAYLRQRIQLSGDPSLTGIDLSRVQVSFANTLWFQCTFINGNNLHHASFQIN